MMKIEESGHTWDTEIWGGRTEDAAAPPPPRGSKFVNRSGGYPPDPRLSTAFFFLTEEIRGSYPLYTS